MWWGEVPEVFSGHKEGKLERQLECDFLVAFVIIMRTHATHYYLESHGSATDMNTHS